MSGHAIHIKVDGRTYSGTYAVDRKNLTVTTSYARKTVEVSPKVQHQALAHQLLEELVKAEKARKGSTLWQKQVADLQSSATLQLRHVSLILRCVFFLSGRCYASSSPQEGKFMAKGGRETKKPKQEKPKTIAAAPSQKGTVASIPQSKK